MSVPTGRAEVVKVASALSPMLLSIATATFVPFTENVTLPVGGPVPVMAGLTKAVNVTDSPTVITVPADDDMPVPAPSFCTKYGVVIELPLKLAVSLLYVAVIERFPAGSAEVFNVACAWPGPGPPVAVIVPSVPEALVVLLTKLKATVPVGVPVPVADEIVTVKVTGWLTTLPPLGEDEIVSEVAVCACAAANDSNSDAPASASAANVRTMLARTREAANTYPRSARARASRPTCRIVFTRKRRPQPNHAR